MRPRKKSLYPALPRGKDAQKSLPAICESIEILTGARGDGLDKAVTRRELVASGAFKLRSGGGSRAPGSTGGGDIIPTDPGTDDEVQFPNKPENVEVNGGFTFIMVEWDEPKFSGFAYAEVWRSGSDALGSATRVATTEGNVYIDPVELESTYYYWVRFVNTKGQAGPPNATAGTLGQTARDINKIRAVMTGVIRATELQSALKERIDLVDAGAEITGSVNARIAAEAEARGIAIDDVTTAISNEQTQRESADSALANNITTLFAAASDNAAAITDEQTARSDADSALATNISNLASTVGDNSSAITAEQTARADGDSALASDISSLTTTVNGNTSSISTVQSTVNGLSAEYMVKLDVNGYVSGFGQYNDGPGASGFLVNADYFAVGKPGQSTKYPFVIGTVNGVTTIMLDASTFIGDATITNAKIANLAVDSSKIANLSVGNAKIGSAAISTAKIQDAAITSAKIGFLQVVNAHIGDAAITSAKIGYAEVDTLRIAGNAVTVPAGSSVDANTTLPSGWITIDYVDIYWGAYNPQSVMVSAFCNFEALSGDSLNVALRVAVSINGGGDSTGGDVALSAVDGYSVIANTNWRFTGNYGSCRYKIQVYTSSGGKYKARGCGITVLGVRR